ncbi:MAG: hypothetical protein IT289_11190 [Oligoflexia bacterium]|nr:hypothetical protein [Oligoflexia bacterium]
MNKLVRTGALVALLVSSLATAEITPVENGYQLEKCGFGSGTPFTATVRETNDSISGQVSPSGCVKTTFRNGRAKPGNNIIVEVGSQKFSETIPGGAPAPGPTNPGLPSVDIRDVEKSASDNARMIANRVVEIYGEAENFRYNLYLGLREGVALYNWTAAYSYEGTGDYRSGYALGQNEGRDQGYRAGESAGRSEGSTNGGIEASSRYHAAVDRGTSPDLTLRVPQANYAGAQPSLGEIKSIDARIQDRAEEIRRSLSRYQYFDNTDFMTIYRWNNYQHDLVKGWYREDWAWEAWRKQSLGGNYQNALDYYAKISDSSRTANAGEASSAFRRKFKSTYDLVIDEKWDRSVRATNPTARTLGLAVGQSVAREMARDLGYRAGYSQSYQASSIPAYRSVYESAFREAFDRRVVHHNNNVVVENVQGRVVDTQGGINYFVPGHPMTVILDRVSNAGLLKGRIDVSVRGAGASVGPAQSFELEGLSSNKGVPVKLSPVGTVADIAPYQDVQVEIVIGAHRLAQNIRVNFTSLVWALGSEGKRQYVDYLKKYLKLEWDKASGDAYKPGKNSLLEQLARTHLQMSPSQRLQVAQVREELRTVYGAKPGMLSSIFTNKDVRYKDAQAYIDQLK